MMNIVTKNNLESQDLEVKVVKVPLAKQILKGHWREVNVVDLRPDRSDPTGNRSVVVFENTDTFQRFFSEAIDERRQSRENNPSVDDLKKEVDELKKIISDMKGE